jgi:hypothetical protein
MALGSGHSLEDLGKEAREENTQIHQLTKRSTQDAAAVKVLTIIMLVYLPATVVLVRVPFKAGFNHPPLTTSRISFRHLLWIKLLRLGPRRKSA